MPVFMYDDFHTHQYLSSTRWGKMSFNGYQNLCTCQNGNHSCPSHYKMSGVAQFGVMTKLGIVIKFKVEVYDRVGRVANKKSWGCDQIERYDQ